MTRIRSAEYLEWDRERAALKRAKAQGFSSVEEHRQSIQSKAPAREVAKAARQAEAARLKARDETLNIMRAAPALIVQVQVRRGPDGKPEPVKQLRAPSAPLELVAEPTIDPTPAPVSTERRPKKISRATGRWEVITSKEEQEAAAGRRQDVAPGRVTSGDPWNRAFDVQFIHEMQSRAHRQRDIESDNLDRYW